MIRATFFAVGLWTLLCGLGLGVLDRGALRLDAALVDDLPFTRVRKDVLWFEPPLWLPFAAVSLGVVVTLYAAALPWRRAEDG